MSLRIHTKDFLVLDRRRDFQIVEPKIFGIGGVDGVGKSLFLKSLAGVVPKRFYSGDIYVGETQIQNLSSSRRQVFGIYYIGDKLSWLDHFSIHQNLQCHFGGISKRVFQAFTDQLSETPELKLQALQPKSDLKPEEILFVYLKFLEWSRSLKVLLFDNPIAGYSKIWQERFNDCLYRFKKKSCSVFYALPAYLEEMPKLDVIFWLDEKDLTFKKLTDEETKTIRLYTSRSTPDASAAFPAKNHAHQARGPMTFQCDGLEVNMLQGEILGLFYRHGSQETPHIHSNFKVQVVTAKKRRKSLFSRFRARDNMTLLLMDELKNFRSFEKKSKEIGEYYGSLFRWPSENFVSELSKIEITKLLLSKALLRKPQILFFDHLTRGLSLYDRKELYQWIRQLSDSGISIVWMSDEIEELSQLSHRVLGLIESNHRIIDSYDLTDTKKLLEAISSLKENRDS